jgi:hypothetical protein
MSASHGHSGFAGPVTLIRPSAGWAPIRLNQLWRCREKTTVVSANQQG